MASSFRQGHGYVTVMLCFCILASLLSSSGAQVEEPSSALEWPTETMSSMYEAMEEDGDGGLGRRWLMWRTMHYYISYGALSANRIPCPPRSGRSYYTHNCFNARGPVHPYTRGCSRITRCRR